MTGARECVGWWSRRAARPLASQLTTEVETVIVCSSQLALGESSRSEEAARSLGDAATTRAATDAVERREVKALFTKFVIEPLAARRGMAVVERRFVYDEVGS